MRVLGGRLNVEGLGFEAWGLRFKVLRGKVSGWA